MILKTLTSNQPPDFAAALPSLAINCLGPFDEVPAAESVVLGARLVVSDFLPLRSAHEEIII